MRHDSIVTCFGEILIDMISTNTGNLLTSRGFLKKIGGAPGNTASGLAKLAVPVSFLGKVGTDPFGAFIKASLDKYGVDTKGLVMSKTSKTTLAFVSLTDTGERDFVFFKGAHDTLRPSEVTLPPNTFIFHFGSLTQISANANRTTEKLIRDAKRQQAILSYDPNIRESLWGDLHRARLVVLDTAKRVNVLKLNEVEAMLLSEESDIPKAANKLYSDNLDILIITNGEHGCFYKTAKFAGAIPTIKVNVVDTTGAGDAFNAGFIYGLYEAHKRASEFSKADLEQILRRAAVIGSLTTTKKGAVTAFPGKKDIEEYLGRLKHECTGN
jgi:fructokinase